MLSDCIAKDSQTAEIYIVQQKEYGAVAKSVRDRMTQAVLPMDDRIVREEGASLEKVLDNDGFKSMIAALGVGMWFPDDKGSVQIFSLDFLHHLRYKKIILVTDESSKGRYIRTQMLSLLYRFLYPLMVNGHVYISPIPSRLKITEASFARQVMSPDTRNLVPLKLGETLASTLELNASLA